MIKNLFRPCCEKCCFIEAEVETKSSDFISGRREDAITTLYCSHMMVCAVYWKSERDTQMGE